MRLEGRGETKAYRNKERQRHTETERTSQRCKMLHQVGICSGKQGDESRGEG